MILLKYLKEECVLVRYRGVDKHSVLKDIAALAIKTGLTADYSEKDIFEALKNREEIGSTGFPGGVAIPHCALEKLEHFIAGVITAPEGIAFDSSDKSLSKIIFFIIGPSRMRTKHIRILSAISRLLIKPGNVEELCTADTPLVLLKKIQSLTGLESPEEGPISPRCLVTVYVQKEDRFLDILEILSGCSIDSLTVLDGANAGHYLNRLPLFSAFWENSEKGFLRIIQAIVEKPFLNDTVRRLNMFPESEDSGKGLMITAQELLYSSGSLDF